ncbi:MAG: hypothetical protein K0Q59_137, partial [Paenibacillus sp.]|nr:hypothetical protein [Paenibacillus sp.]
MYIDLDVHPESNRMAVLQRLPDGSKNIVIHDIATKKAVGEVDSYFIPQGPRFSPDGRLLAFFGDGAINI